MLSLKGNIASFATINTVTLEPEDRIVYINMDSIDCWHQVVSGVMDIYVKDNKFRVEGYADLFEKNYLTYMNERKNIR